MGLVVVVVTADPTQLLHYTVPFSRNLNGVYLHIITSVIFRILNKFHYLSGCRFVVMPQVSFHTVFFLSYLSMLPKAHFQLSYPAKSLAENHIIKVTSKAALSGIRPALSLPYSRTYCVLQAVDSQKACSNPGF